MKKKILDALSKLKVKILDLMDFVIEKVSRPFFDFYVRHIKREDRKQMNRRLLFAASLIVMLDYLLVCYHVDRNPLDIFPGIPKLEGRSEVTVYVTDIEGKNLLKEKRLLETDDTRENVARELVNFVLAGGNSENTKISVPITGNIRKIWFYEDKCIVDFRCEIIPDDVNIIPGAEDVFRRAVEETIKANISGVKTVIISENGIPGKKLWEPFKEEVALTDVAEPKAEEKPL